jgi:hypothetical protein
MRQILMFQRGDHLTAVTVPRTRIGTMRSSRNNHPYVLVAISLIGLAGCAALPRTTAVAAPIVGTWIVRDTMAPFPYHMYVFNADGTMQQANPDAGDPHSSDSDGKGVWTARENRIVGRWVEITADRTTHKYSGRTEISFEIHVNGDTLTGTETVKIYDANERLTELPAGPAFQGTRVTLP